MSTKRFAGWRLGLVLLIAASFALIGAVFGLAHHASAAPPPSAPGQQKFQSDALDTDAIADCSVGNAPVECVSRTLPAGSWSLEYRGIYQHDFAAITNLNPTCLLASNGVTLDSYAGRFGANGDFVVLIATVDVSAPAQITVTCSASQDFVMESQRLIASQVGTIQPWGP